MKLRGQLIIEEYHSRCLEGNPLGDSPEREIPVYLPEGYLESREYPLIVMLAGFTGSGLSHINWSAWGETFPERLERLIEAGKVPPCVAIMPDPFTKLGGCQYINSSAVGDYEDHLTGELIPWARQRFRSGMDAEETVIAGKSSGGYGAFVLAARHPDLFGWALVHSADCYFEYAYQTEFPVALREMRKYESVQAMIASYSDPLNKPGNSAVNQTAMAACYSPNPDSPYRFDYPFDLETGEIREDVWARWLAHDPVRMVESAVIVSNLKKLSGLYIECGMKDEFHLQWGTRILSRKLKAAGVPHEHSEFEAGHFNLQWRFDESLSWWGRNR
jgi:pimeloyl-ACP methyl ester carboxylesterase